MFSRKPNPPSRSPSPPSPKLAPNLDCAFPPLALKPNLSKGAKGLPMNNMYAPLSPRPQGGAEVLQRMNTIAPGPFGHRARPSQQRLQQRLPDVPNVEARGVHSRHGSMKQEFRNEQGRQHFRKASTASSVRSQGSHYSQQSADSQTHHRRNESAVTRPSEAIDKFLDELQSEPSGSPIESPEMMKARLFPEVAEDRPRPKFIGAGLHPQPHYRTEFPQRGPVEEKRPETSAGATGAGYGGFSALSDPAVQNLTPAPNPYKYDNSTPTESRRPRSRTVTPPSNQTPVPQRPQFERPRASPLPTGENMSLPNILRAGSRERAPIPAGDPVAFGAGATRSRSRTITRPSESNNDMRPPMPTAPAFPTLNKLMTDQPIRGEMYHSPSDSGSSGYASTDRSTPPSSVGSSISRSGSTDSTNERYWDGGAFKAPAFLQPNSLQRPRMSASSDLYNPPESPVDPAIQRMRLPNEAELEIASRNVSTESQPRRAPDMRPFLRAATAATAFSKPSKGNCAACQQPIYGKSVKAAGGKLTGRYHKECFACKTCQAPFPTAEFYVLNNAPYCGRHYHELNGSLCRKCDLGIEGQYLQTDRREKYHAHCFSCIECRVRLTEDYLEVNGEPFCERHAYSMTRNRAPQYGNSNLGVHGASRPEKRRTRLMMM